MSRNQTYLILIIGLGCMAIACAAIVMAGAYYIISTSDTQSSSDIVVVPQNPRPKADKNSMGDPNAPIQIVEFGDFQCPFCKRFHLETESLLVEHYIETGKIRFTYRSMGNFISQNLGYENTESSDAAFAAYCAADQNKFWGMHDMLFANNRNVENDGAFTRPRLSDMARSIGLDMSVFQDCFESGKYDDRIQQDYADAITAGIQGTPSFVVTYQLNDEVITLLIEGAQPFQAFQQILDQILEEIGE